MSELESSAMMDSGTARFRLRDKNTEKKLWFDLAPGHNRVGSGPDNEVQLAEPGVSRHHALLIVGGRGLRVEDLQSKNGTLVNDLLVSRHQLQPGDVVGFGPLRFTVEAVDPREAELAFCLELPAPAEDRPAAVETPSQHLDRQAIGAWFDLVDAFVERLSLPPRPDVSGALRRLDEILGSRGDQVILLGASGRLGRPPAALADHPSTGD